MSFAEEVYSILRKVPRGKVCTYQEIAKAIGKPNSWRAVGNALNKNPYAPEVPCHRVVRSNGELGGFAYGQSEKIKRLREEGVLPEKGKVDLEKFGHYF